jgi:hypothetical protein
MTKEEFLVLREQGLTFTEIGLHFNLSEHQVRYRTKAWGLNYAKKKTLNDGFFSSNTKAAYYWAGFIAADGWIEGDRNRVGLALQNSDYAHLEKFKKAVGSSHNICPFMHNTAFRIRFTSQRMVEDLCNIFNITPTKTHTYTMPYFEETYLMLEFFRGYIEGDGHLHKTNSNRVALNLCSANIHFLEDFRNICETLLDKNITQKIYNNVNKKGSVFAITLNLADSADLLNLLYKN